MERKCEKKKKKEKSEGKDMYLQWQPPMTTLLILFTISYGGDEMAIPLKDRWRVV